MPYIPPKLEDGLQPFLDEPRKLARHNGHGYGEWADKYLHQYLTRRWSMKDLMHYMNVKDYKTMNSWISQFEQERGNTIDE